MKKETIASLTKKLKETNESIDSMILSAISNHNLKLKDDIESVNKQLQESFIKNKDLIIDLKEKEKQLNITIEDISRFRTLLNNEYESKQRIKELLNRANEELKQLNNKVIVLEAKQSVLDLFDRSLPSKQLGFCECVSISREIDTELSK